MSFNCVNNYVPKDVPRDLPWYEQDGLMTYNDQVKCEEFLRDSDNYFKTVRIINFDVIWREVASEKVPEELLKHYQNERVKKYPKNDQDKFLGGAFHTRRRDIFCEKDVVLNHFKKEK